MQKILDTPWTRSTIAKGHTESQEDSEAKNFMITVFFLLYPHFFPPSLAPLPPFKSLHPSLLLSLPPPHCFPLPHPCVTPASPSTRPLPQLDLSLYSPLPLLASPSTRLSLAWLLPQVFSPSLTCIQTFSLIIALGRLWTTWNLGSGSWWMWFVQLCTLLASSLINLLNEFWVQLVSVLTWCCYQGTFHWKLQTWRDSRSSQVQDEVVLSCKWFRGEYRL